MCPLHGGSWREYEREKRLGKVVQEPKGERERPGDGDGYGVEGGLSRRIRGMDGYEYDEEVHSVLETFAKRNNDSGDRKLSGLVADALATPGRSCSPIGDYKLAHGYWGAPRVVVRGGAMPIGGLQPAIRGGKPLHEE
uniref:Uncharacterized protein n=1 Tax=Vespula pensylvanica TaxID=30213 RepID=A0A834U8X2_VESPE|nr:hypothetical protein H0235_009921 [Vespula pensylvanica]